MRQSPARDCPLCPRLVAFREELRAVQPDWHNAPVASFGPADARLLIVGLAPGMRGANRTGRPFTGDYAGDVLYPALARNGFTRGDYDARRDDGFELVDCRITNAVRCVPPQNKPIGAEVASCRTFLVQELSAGTAPEVVLTLGRIAFETTLRAQGLPLASYRFAHAAVHALPRGLTLVGCYHSSRYNINTGRVTPAMIEDAIAIAARHLRRSPRAEPAPRPAIP